MPAPTASLRLLDLAVAALGRWRTAGGSPRDAVAWVLPRDLEPQHRAAVARSVYGVVSGGRRLEHAFAEIPAFDRLPPGSRDAALLLACRVARGELDPAAARARGSARGLGELPFERVPALAQALARIADPVRRFALQYSLPDWLAARLLAEFGDQAAALAAALESEPPRTIRANTLRVQDRSALARELAAAGVATAPTAFAPQALQVHGEASLSALSLYAGGGFEQQDEGSQLAVLAVAPPPRGKVLDACAGAGGKTLAIAATLQNRGLVLAADVHAGRLAALRQRAGRAGAHNVQTALVAEDCWPEPVRAFAGGADRILLDVPCSGIGSWRRRPEARWALTPESMPSLQAQQAGLLDRAAAVLRPGARIVYVTCTLFADENERQVASALQRHPELELVRLAEILGADAAAAIADPTGSWLSLRPDRHGTDGFFAAVLRRRRG